MAQQIVQEVTTTLRLMISEETGGYGQRQGRGGEPSGFNPRRRQKKPRGKYPGVKRRSAAENMLSVGLFSREKTAANDLPHLQEHIRQHMASLIPQHEWLEDVIYLDELNQWDPADRKCCTARSFRLHLNGTPADLWNTSAARVFTDDFLLTHADLYPDVWPVRYMVLKKTRAHIKSLIRRYKLKHTTKPARDALKVMQNRRERKAAVRHEFSPGDTNEVTDVLTALPQTSRRDVPPPADGTTTENARGFGH